MDEFIWFGGQGGVFGAMMRVFSDSLGLKLFPLLFAVLTPILLIYGRYEVRLRRLRSIKDFLQSFGSAADKRQPVGHKTGDGLSANPSFEYVKSKYTSDLDIGDDGDRKFDGMSEIDQINWIITKFSSFGLSADWRMLFSTTGIILLMYFGFTALETTLLCGLGETSCAAPDARYGNWQQLVTIGSLAFAGAYIAAVRAFVRAIAVFDLTPYTFLRHSVEIVASVIFAIVLFAVFRDPMSTVGELLGRATDAVGITKPETAPGTGAGTGSSINAIWYGLAPVLGLLPQSATKFALVRFQSILNWIKISDDRFMDVTMIISLDIIDGIDYETRFRLEECGIFDVQNLATYNPIMLHIETPYKIYQTLDWVAQAQLCHIVGPEKFLMFREINIRTILDLERAISGEASPDAFDQICASILFASTEAMKKTMEVSKTQLTIFENDKARQVGADEFSLWLRQKIESANASEAAEHVLRWIADDLHVRRLRRVWIDISESLGENSWYLPDNKDAIAQRKARAEKEEAERKMKEAAASEELAADQARNAQPVLLQSG